MTCRVARPKDGPRVNNGHFLVDPISSGEVDPGRPHRAKGGSMMLRLLSAGAVLLAMVTLAQANAQCGPHGGTTCGIGLVCCGGSCIDPFTDSDNCGVCKNQCGGGEACFDGFCACPDPELLCGNQCADPLSDPNNCGFCHNECKENSQCCDGACTDTARDPNNCGACGTVCDSTCVKGVCVVP
jgi:hypothetical protein